MQVLERLIDRPLAVVTRRLREILAGYVKALPQYPALLGDGQGNVAVVGWPGWVWVRIGSDEILARAFNQRLPLIDDLTIIVGYDWLQPTLFQVLSMREAYAGAGTGQKVVPQVPPHGHTHEWPTIDDDDSDGSDTGYWHWRQIRGLRIYIVSGFTIGIERWPIRRGSTNIWIASQTLDLEPDKPGGGARYVTVYLDSDGVLQRRLGSVVGADVITIADAPLTVMGEWELANVLLWPTQTALQDDGDRQDIIDRRFPATFSAGMPDHTITGDLHTDAVGTPVEGDVLTYATGYWRPQPGGGGSGDEAVAEVTTPRWHADGPLAVLDEVDGVWRLSQNFRIDSIVIYLKDIGSAGITTVDVDKSLDDGVSWVTIFSTQADRPSITGGGADHTASGTPTAVQNLLAGTWLRMNIEVVGTGARNLSVHPVGVGGESVGSRLTHMGAG